MRKVAAIAQDDDVYNWATVNSTKIMKLYAHNYHIWVDEAISLLVDSDLWEYILLDIQYILDIFLQYQAYAKPRLFISVEILQEILFHNENIKLL